MTKLESRIATIRTITRAFLVTALLGTLSYAVLFVGKDFITPEIRGTVLGALVGGFSSAMIFYFKKNEEHVEKEEVTNETETE